MIRPIGYQYFMNSLKNLKPILTVILLMVFLGLCFTAKQSAAKACDDKKSKGGSACVGGCWVCHDDIEHSYERPVVYKEGTTPGEWFGYDPEDPAHRPSESGRIFVNRIKIGYQGAFWKEKHFYLEPATCSVKYVRMWPYRICARYVPPADSDCRETGKSCNFHGNRTAATGEGRPQICAYEDPMDGNDPPRQVCGKVDLDISCNSFSPFHHGQDADQAISPGHAAAMGGVTAGAAAGAALSATSIMHTFPVFGSIVAGLSAAFGATIGAMVGAILGTYNHIVVDTLDCIDIPLLPQPPIFRDDAWFNDDVLYADIELVTSADIVADYKNPKVRVRNCAYDNKVIEPISSRFLPCKGVPDSTHPDASKYKEGNVDLSITGVTSGSKQICEKKNGKNWDKVECGTVPRSDRAGASDYRTRYSPESEEFKSALGTTTVKLTKVELVSGAYTDVEKSFQQSYYAKISSEQPNHICVYQTHAIKRDGGTRALPAARRIGCVKRSQMPKPKLEIKLPQRELPFTLQYEVGGGTSTWNGIIKNPVGTNIWSHSTSNPHNLQIVSHATDPNKKCITRVGGGFDLIYPNVADKLTKSTAEYYGYITIGNPQKRVYVDWHSKCFVFTDADTSLPPAPSYFNLIVEVEGEKGHNRSWRNGIFLDSDGKYKSQHLFFPEKSAPNTYYFQSHSADNTKLCLYDMTDHRPINSPAPNKKGGTLTRMLIDDTIIEQDKIIDGYCFRYVPHKKPALDMFTLGSVDLVLTHYEYDSKTQKNITKDTNHFNIPVQKGAVFLQALVNMPHQGGQSVVYLNGTNALPKKLCISTDYKKGVTGYPDQSKSNYPTGGAVLIKSATTNGKPLRISQNGQCFDFFIKGKLEVTVGDVVQEMLSGDCARFYLKEICAYRPCLSTGINSVAPQDCSQDPLKSEDKMCLTGFDYDGATVIAQTGTQAPAGKLPAGPNSVCSSTKKATAYALGDVPPFVEPCSVVGAGIWVAYRPKCTEFLSATTNQCKAYSVCNSWNITTGKCNSFSAVEYKTPTNQPYDPYYYDPNQFYERPLLDHELGLCQSF